MAGFGNRSGGYGRVLFVAGLIASAGSITVTRAQSASASLDPPRELSLVEARAEARAHSPLLGAAEAEVAAARADLATARTYPFNPEIELEGANRDSGGASSRDRGVAVGQELEIAGQRGRRVAAAEQGLAAAEARRDRRRAEVDATVTRAFGAAVAASELESVAALDVELAERLRGFEESRLDAGAGTQLDVNTARAAAARARRQLEQARAEAQVARAELAEATGRPGTAAPVAGSRFPSLDTRMPDLAALVGAAIPRRADLVALRHEVEQADRRVELERSLRVPNLRLGGFSRTEEGDDITGASIAIPVPLFNRNRGAVAQAEALAARARADRATAELAARREIAAAYARYRGAEAAVAALQSGVVGGLEESLALLQQAFEAGKIGSRDLLVFRRELIESRREHAEAQAELAAAAADLELATAGVVSFDKESSNVP